MDLFNFPSGGGEGRVWDANPAKSLTPTGWNLQLQRAASHCCQAASRPPAVPASLNLSYSRARVFSQRFTQHLATLCPRFGLFMALM